jgi:hypothetical protein
MEGLLLPWKTKQQHKYWYVESDTSNMSILCLKIELSIKNMILFYIFMSPYRLK